MSPATTPAEIQTAEHLCPTHGKRLLHTLKGGSGYCLSCRAYVQSVNHPMPELDAAIAAKRADVSKPKPKKRAKAKPRKKTKAKREARQIEPGRNESRADGAHKYFP